MKTIRQIADEIGVSKQAVQKRIAREPLYTRIHPCIQVIDNTKYIDETGEKLIKTTFIKVAAASVGIDTGIDASIDKSKNVYTLAIDKTEDVYTHVHTLISMLQGELDAKNKQIEAQQQTISEMTSALEHTTASLHAAQALHAGTMQTQLVIEADQPIKKNLLQRLFSRG